MTSQLKPAHYKCGAQITIIPAIPFERKIHFYYVPFADMSNSRVNKNVSETNILFCLRFACNSCLF